MDEHVSQPGAIEWDQDQGWVEVPVQSGRLAKVRYGGLISRGPLKATPPPPEYDVSDIALGPLEDLLWEELPEVRPRLCYVVVQELDIAIDHDRVLWPLSPYTTCSEFFMFVFRPALNDYPRTRDLAARCCTVLKHIFELDDALGRRYLDALQLRVIEWLVLPRYRPIIEELDPELMVQVDTRDPTNLPSYPHARSKRMNDLPAPRDRRDMNQYVGLPGADERDLGRGWVEVWVRPGRVARIRYGGLTSWAVLKVAPPHPERDVMDIGLGPLEDLLWEELPEVRPALRDTVMKELEHATEQDRVLWPLSPYTTCGDCFGLVFRPSLDDYPRTRDLAARCCTVLKHIFELDDAIGRTYLDALQSNVIEWLVLPRYRPIIEELDPELMAQVDARASTAES